MSVFVVDNEITNSVLELGEIIDTIQSNTEYSESLSPLISVENDEIKDKSSLIQKVYQASSPDYLKKLNDKEFEPTFNLIVYILSQLEGGITKVFEPSNSDTLLSNLINSSPSQQLSLRDRKSIKATSILSELTLIFNLLPNTSSARVKIIDQILQFVEKLKIDFNILQQSFGENLVLWLQEANTSDEKTRQVFWKFVELDEKHTLTTLNIIKKFTTQHELNKDELHKLINFSFNSEIIDVSFLINNNVNKALQNYKDDKVVSVFIKYLRGEIIEESEFTQVPFKSQMLSLCKYFEKSEKSKFQFNEIPVSNERDLEILLINCIKNGLIEGKLDQTSSTFYLTRVNKFILPGDDELVQNSLEKVKYNLQAWKKSLVSVGDVVNTFRVNAK